MPYPPARRACHAELVARSFSRHAASLSGLTVRLAEERDTADIAAMEARQFDALRRGRQRLGPEYRADLFCENRQGWLLRAVAEDARGLVGYGIAQIRPSDLYLYELCAAPGAGRPGHDIFYTLARVAQALGLADLTAVVSRADKARALTRLHRRVGLRAAPVRFFALTGERLGPDWICSRGAVAQILDIPQGHSATRGS